MEKKQVKSRLRNDIILIGAMILIALVCLLVFLIGNNGGYWAVVTVDGKEISRYNLALDGEYPVRSGENGEFLNVVVISDGKVSVSEANCPDGICVDHHPISGTWETIVCLPHKLVVHVESEDLPDIDMAS